jgi:GT2 family glycosyltransferase
VRPVPSFAHASNAFFCTCNASVPRNIFNAVGRFDESFDKYGWEDTELGVRLRRFDVRRTFAWDAYLWHIKPPATETLDAALDKTIEKARMAARFVRKDRSIRAKLATGAYGANRLRARLLAPAAAQAWLAGVATSDRVPPALARVARELVLDSVYVDELERALR